MLLIQSSLQTFPLYNSKVTQSYTTLVEYISQVCNIPAQHIILSTNNQNITLDTFETFYKENILSKTNSTITVKELLCGGKGGFGNALRSKSSKFGAKKNTDISACRDLSGRRMRHVQAEKDLREWMSKEHNVDQTDIQAKYAQINQGTLIVPKECKFGLGCKYRLTSCKKLHPVDPEEIRKKEMKEELKNLSHGITNINTDDIDDQFSNIQNLGSTDDYDIKKSIAKGLLLEQEQKDSKEDKGKQVIDNNLSKSGNTSHVVAKASKADYGLDILDDFSDDNEDDSDDESGGDE